MNDNIIQTAREIVHACLVREFLTPKRERPSDPVELEAEVETYCRNFGTTTSSS